MTARVGGLWKLDSHNHLYVLLGIETKPGGVHMYNLFSLHSKIMSHLVSPFGEIPRGFTVLLE